jgi:F-type H+-transporting ATPase subunit b
MVLSVTLMASEGAPPLLDLDWTVAVQFGLFVVMLLILSRYLFKPYLKILDERVERTDGARRKAEEAQTEARAKVADYEARLAAAKQKGNDERLRLRQEGAVREREVLGLARDEANRKIDEARKQIVGDTAAAKKQLEAEATALAQQLATKVLGRKVTS